MPLVKSGTKAGTTKPKAVETKPAIKKTTIVKEVISKPSNSKAALKAVGKTAPVSTVKKPSKAPVKLLKVSDLTVPDIKTVDDRKVEAPLLKVDIPANKIVGIKSLNVKDVFAKITAPVNDGFNLSKFIKK